MRIYISPVWNRLVAVAGLCIAVAALSAGDSKADPVAGYFCNSKTDQIAFLTKQAEGKNELLAADAVNKAAARQSCAYYRAAEAVPRSEQVFMDKGIVFKIQSFVFLPEGVERWYGTTFGSLDVPVRKQNI